jgi:hypothetical protein
MIGQPALALIAVEGSSVATQSSHRLGAIEEDRRGSCDDRVRPPNGGSRTYGLPCETRHLQPIEIACAKR